MKLLLSSLVDQAFFWLPILGVGFALSFFALVFLLFRVRTHMETAREAQAQADRAGEKLVTLERLSDERLQRVDSLAAETKVLQNRFEQAITEKSSLEAQANELRQQRDKEREELKAIRSEATELREKNGELLSDNATLKTAKAHQEKHLQEHIQQLTENREVLRQEFVNMANDMLESKGRILKEQNQESLTALINPFKEQIELFKTRVEDIHHKETQSSSELKVELGNLRELNTKITQEAHDLAVALRGQKKMQGNWGELILENVLDRSGLVRDRDYRREVSLDSEEGRKRPDVLVNLPDGKHLIIDSKVSLNDYTDFVNASDEVQRELCLKRHVEAVNARMMELSLREYSSVKGINSPDVVFMFIPIESAFVEAVRADENLFQRAIEKNILIATPTTLLTSLNIVKQLWRFENQNQHTRELADKAGKVYKKLCGFLHSMEKLDNALGSTRKVFDDAMTQLSSGKGNLIKQASEFQQLGVSVTSALPERLVERAALEFDVVSIADDEQAA
jgi:DNA recombination protein RmuC